MTGSCYTIQNVRVLAGRILPLISKFQFNFYHAHPRHCPTTAEHCCHCPLHHSPPRHQQMAKIIKASSPSGTPWALATWKLDTRRIVRLQFSSFSKLTTLRSAYRKFEEWTQQYGPVFSLRQGRTTVIVVGRMQAAVDIMEREGAALLDRPLSISAGETLSGGMRVLLTPAGERFKKMRRCVT